MNPDTPIPSSPVLLITGGSRGIGASVARLAAQQGHAVCISYRHRGDLAEALVAEIRADGGRALAVQADVAVEADVLRLFERVAAELGPLTGLVNNAGMLETQMRVADMGAERLRRVFDTNIVGSFLCAREAVRRMSTARGGTGGAIVNLSSRAARLGAPGEFVDYAASKGAIDSFTIGLSREVADEGIRVNAVAPGLIETEIHASAGEPGRVERLKAGVPMRRGGHPDEVARAVLWLLSAEASYITGTVVDVSGGR
ncbi:SDR family oxidoreductase [Sphaerotilus sp.]|uniref:SDR family oxidoreductase n=1 Tax=Sphaerotilus sp. TaxID=2093942 RepID=UPI002ACDB1B1|nr:SDR family oxidoreductase [Sphaerotilus sp.]MDZ7858730.1 SDR family oxidoreductase [Sphaerotilus sp.]